MKNSTRKKPGQLEPRVHLERYDLNMLQGSKWHESCNRMNKTGLIRLIAQFLKEDRCCTGAIPLVFTVYNETFQVFNGIVQEMKKCSHEEAETRLISLYMLWSLHWMLSLLQKIRICLHG